MVGMPHDMKGHVPFALVTPAISKEAQNLSPEKLLVEVNGLIRAGKRHHKYSTSAANLIFRSYFNLKMLVQSLLLIASLSAIFQKLVPGMNLFVVYHPIHLLIDSFSSAVKLYEGRSEASSKLAVRETMMSNLRIHQQLKT